MSTDPAARSAPPATPAARTARAQAATPPQPATGLRGDITLPPAEECYTPAPASPAAAAGADPDAALRQVMFHTLATTALTGMFLAWTLGRGAVPALDPVVGPANLVLHLGALLTAWLALDGAQARWREHAPAALDANVATLATAVAITAMVTNLGMMVGAALP
jgi:hypothetical protein